MVPGRCLVLFAAACWADPIVFNDDGAWNWFQDERAVIEGRHLYVGSVAAGVRDPRRAGAVEVVTHNLETGQQARTVLHQGQTAVERKRWLNDHSAPALASLGNGRVVAAFTLHSLDNLIHFRTATRQSWDAEGFTVAATPESRVCFPSLVARQGQVYAFFRGLDGKSMPSVTRSAAADLEFAVPFLWLPPATAAKPPVPYVKYATTGGGPIHAIYTLGHHFDYGNQLVHRSFTDPAQPSAPTVIYQAGTTSVVWLADAAVDRNNRPFAAYSIQPNSSSLPMAERGRDHRYRYAYWDRSRWVDTALAYAGSRVHTYADGDDCTGLVALDPYDPNTVYLSANADPATGAPLPHWEIFEARTRDRGKTWSFVPVTSKSRVDNLRPIVPADPRYRVLLWMQGTMKTYTDYDLRIVGNVAVRGK